MKRVALHLLVVSYLVVTLAALLFTLQRVVLPVPQQFLLFSYSMMAPFQGYSRENDELKAEGKLSDGRWVPIDLGRYYPLHHGWESVRMRLRSFRVSDDDDPRGVEALRAKYEELALLLLERERRHGRMWRSIRLVFEEWPLSTLSYEALRLPPFVEAERIIQIP